MRRIVVRHPDTGLRIAVAVDEYDDPEAHPHNHDHQDIATAPFNDEPAEIFDHAGRRGASRKSLMADGYIPVAWIDDNSRETPITEEDEPSVTDLMLDDEWKAMDTRARADLLDRQLALVHAAAQGGE